MGLGNAASFSEDTEITETAPKMGRGDLAAILRGGSGAITKWGTGDVDPYVEFRKTSIEELLARGKELDELKEVEIKIGVGGSEEVDEATKHEHELAAAEEEERVLLAGREMVQSRVFEGKTYERSVGPLLHFSCLRSSFVDPLSTE